MKKLLGLLAVAPMVVTACGGSDNVEKFTAKESFGSSTSIYVFDGETTNGEITELDFDVLIPGSGESKKDIDNYHMNVSHVNIVANATDATQFDVEVFAGGCLNECSVSADQFMDYGTMANVQADTKLADLTWKLGHPTFGGDTTYKLDAWVQAGAEFDFVPTLETTLIEWANGVESITGDDLKVSSKRFGFEGIHGGRTYGEQLEAIENYILEEKMTLKEAKKFFEAGQFDSNDDLVVSGASISFVSSFARIVDVAMGNELEEGILDSGDGWYTVRTAGYKGDIDLKVTFDEATKDLIKIEVVAEDETDSIGGKEITEEKLAALVVAANAGTLDDASEITGSTVTFNAVVKGIKYVLAELA